MVKLFLSGSLVSRLGHDPSTTLSDLHLYRPKRLDALEQVWLLGEEQRGEDLLNDGVHLRTGTRGAASWRDRFVTDFVKVTK